ncbi:HNH endonuclease [Clostridium botulinum]|uniref:HNH endonuclease domain protein n=1 Tax=Clostridium botulinum (strain Kyoto / Type A2) TaxID=536232 RepID=C1FMA9_CLOBJ|nr:HNH endonuclease [Clostridium botulinum]ACO86620.1 HNH endonuclease domain protein [Clostridium botulinum A2 str. Kyoto]MBN3376161.1 HNH endonuclease [Clostridium botulinum]MBN3403542.1 HNH endonuclease [Clostridium botulinum]MBN3449087.1 HNH endonuclease [Clostridium botulinum]
MCSCKDKRYKEEDKYKKDTKEKQFYSSEEWSIMRDKAKDKYKGIDIYSYYVLGIIEYGQTVHHIEPIKKNWNKRLDINNLIYLTESNHKKLHYRMDHGEEQEVIKELYELIKKFEKEMIN